LVIGAGTSLEAPTSLRLSAYYAADAHRRLLADSILAEPCADPSDLSLVADKVYECRGSQEDLVRELPRAEFQEATPNEGHLLAAAMLMEGAISNCLSLNYDLAMSHALAQLRCGGKVAVIQGPEHREELGRTNLIYLHRSANSDPEEWILRSSVINDAWRDGWEEVITNMVLTSPVVVFVGLGSPAAVLTESVRKIRAALRDANSVFYVGPGEPGGSPFFAQLQLPEDAGIEMGWVEFMQALSQRLVEEHRSQLIEACQLLSNQLQLNEEGAPSICDRLAMKGLYHLGCCRAFWTEDDAPFIESSPDRHRWMADFVLAIALIERIGNCTAHLNDDGTVEFRDDQRILSVVVLAHGRGILRWPAMEDRIVRNEARWRGRNPIPTSAIIGGVTGPRAADSAVPINIVGGDPEGSLVSGPTAMRLLSVDELRADPACVREILER